MLHTIINSGTFDSENSLDLLMEFSKSDSAIFCTLYFSVKFWSIAKCICVYTRKFKYANMNVPLDIKLRHWAGKQVAFSPTSILRKDFRLQNTSP